MIRPETMLSAATSTISPYPAISTVAFTTATYGINTGGTVYRGDSFPERFRGRKLYKHNPNVTLMRTSALSTGSPACTCTGTARA